VGGAFRVGDYRLELIVQFLTTDIVIIVTLSRDVQGSRKRKREGGINSKIK